MVISSSESEGIGKMSKVFILVSMSSIVIFKPLKYYAQMDLLFLLIFLIELYIP